MPSYSLVILGLLAVFVVVPIFVGYLIAAGNPSSD